MQPRFTLLLHKRLSSWYSFILACYDTLLRLTVTHGSLSSAPARRAARARAQADARVSPA